MTKILVVGASGYIGRYVTQFLAMRGHDVIGIARSDKRFVQSPAVKVIAGNVGDRTVANEIFRSSSVSHIINCAGLVRSSNAESLRVCNVDLIRVIAETAPLTAKVIHLSSDMAAEPVGLYGASKRSGDEVLMARRPDSIVLMLSPVYGSFLGSQGSTFTRLLVKLRKRMPILVPKGGEFQVYPLYLGDLGRALEMIVGANRGISGTFGLHGVVCSFRRWLDVAEMATGLKVLRLPVPLAPLQMFATAFKRLFPQIPLQGVLQIGRRLPVSNDRIAEAVGFEPVQHFEAIREIVTQEDALTRAQMQGPAP